ncbi:hypothetical protein [Providencia stuartii]|uniref:hypothetical protein n=1 Tax=Providencia stuartii TaxID=588 RepID=UPI00112014CC|nr:hypothetical protein [Providencia stuartii]
MNLVEKFSVIGSLASTAAIAVAFTVFWIQRKDEFTRTENDRKNELLALKKIIVLNCESIKNALLENQKILDVILSRKYAGTSIQKAGEYFYIVFKDGYDEEKNEYFWSTNQRFYFAKKFLDRELLTLAKHNQDIITSFMDVTKSIDEANNTLLSLINDFINHNYSMIKIRTNTVDNYSKTLNLKIDNLMYELSLI